MHSPPPSPLRGPPFLGPAGLSPWKGCGEFPKLSRGGEAPAARSLPAACPVHPSHSVLFSFLLSLFVSTYDVPGTRLMHFIPSAVSSCTGGKVRLRGKKSHLSRVTPPVRAGPGT